MIAVFDLFTIRMTRLQADAASRPGQPADAAVAELVMHPKVQRQLRRIDPSAIRAELSGYGAWDAEELQDDAQNQHRIVWCAACDIRENHPVRKGREPELKSYDVVQLVEMTVRHRVRAASATEANNIATARTRRKVDKIANRYKGVGFGDIMEDYVPATDDDDELPTHVEVTL